MPTPSEVITALPSPPNEGPSSSRASFASCPPAEDDGERFALLGSEAGLVDSPSLGAGQGDEDAVEEDEIEEDGDERMTTITQEPTPEADLKPEARLSEESKGRRRDEGDGEKIVSSGESEAYLAHSMATAAISPSGEQPLYLTFPPDRSRVG